MTGPALEIRDVSVSFGMLSALSGVSAAVGNTEIVSIIGPNGAGKTTLLNTISGLLVPQKGAIVLSGTDVTRMPPYKRPWLGLGRTFQHARLVDDLSVLENVVAGAYVQPVRPPLLAEWLRMPRAAEASATIYANASRLLELLGIAALAHVPAGQLSFGRRKLVDLARSLMGEPRLLLMDEPTAGLAESEIESLVGVVRRIRENRAIVVVAHHMGFISKLADRVICLVAGKLIAEGSPREIQGDPAVLAAYMGADDAG